MSDRELAVVGIGNAIVDVIGKVDDALLEREGLTKGSMALIDAERAGALQSCVADAAESCGGSAGNTIAGVASLGGTVGYVGKVGQDRLGDVFAGGMLDAGVEYRTARSETGVPTACCIVMVTPDAQRTMNTFLGASVELGPDDVDESLVRRGRVTYLEGYLWDPPRAKEAFLRAAAIAHGAQRTVSLSLSDSFCVARHRDSFRDLVAGHVDVLFANEDEIRSLYETDDFEAAVAAVRSEVRIAALTRGEQGCTIVWEGEVVEVAAAPVERVVDTTGAGDLFAAGFLHGLVQGQSAVDCGRLGGLCAAEIIGHYGARPEARLAELTRSRLG
jgi:sugar/nucleoside kinase (ribokinase family)